MKADGKLKAVHRGGPVGFACLAGGFAMKFRWLLIFIISLGFAAALSGEEDAPRTSSRHLKWEPLPALPDALGVAGPFVGVHNEALIVAGGANFPVADGEDLWKVPKVWHDEAWVLTKTTEGKYNWRTGFKLARAVGYGACVNSPRGIVCIGGNDATSTFANVFLLKWDAELNSLSTSPLPDLPQPLVYGAAAIIGNTVYIAGGQTDQALTTATTFFARLNLSALDDAKGPKAEWEILPPWPGPARAFNLVAAQHNGFDDCIYVIGGRMQNPAITGDAGIVALADVYEFNPKSFDKAAFDAKADTYRGQGEFANPWRRRADAPRPIMAGTASAIGQSHIFILSGADGELMKRIAQDPEFAKTHPGFPKRTWAYHTITDTWIDAGASPSNQVTTPPARWGKGIIVASGEVKPRVRTTQVWLVTPVSPDRSFGAVNFAVLVLYLLAMVGVGIYFTRRNKNTDDYFRGGQRVVWWAAGCSIFATMLSSITYMAIPAKAYAQDWVYLMGNMMILAVAPIAVYLALPFFRRIDATSAYEYLQKRFNLPVRLFGSASFTIFHIFRMAIVMSLAGLALATVTPLTASQCVLIMGVLSIIYCTLGGVEAVIWTDTIQTFVLLGGALVCFIIMASGTDGGLGGLLDAATKHNKLHTFNFHWDATSTSLALWVVIIGAIGQNISSYTADQAVVQRYMTTPDQKRAARSIWFAAILAIPASFLFFGLGTGLFAFYQSNPDKLDATFMTDQIFPLFIADQVPVGLAGLIVAGIFAAAQSTISTSMNSTATAVVTDFLRPFNALTTERGYLNAARTVTLLLGILGTLLGLLFVDPSIKSLFDKFLMIIGLFMGVLGGLFAMGVLTKKCNGPGALIGVIVGAAVMFAMPYFTKISGYLYAAIGLTTCFGVGYFASLLLPVTQKDLAGLTIHKLGESSSGEEALR
ncbi:MAG: sodium/solute symporter [Phycisphaeraceae bacterium]